MSKIKILNEIENTNLVRVEIDKKISIKYKSDVDKMIQEEKYANNKR